MELSLYWIEGGALVEGVAQFKYLAIPLYQSNDNFLGIRQNNRSKWKVWYHLGKILLWEGVDTQAQKMFYQLVV